ncbi:pentatricopeptide repeat-containing protein [Senna tora]|uniref:Pentatricopeptide repeat-containing protein n=1 Tax=Senna tora TaxID=362788 RepID=A0A834W1V2_9FABA|nr:pentatricopeptide repeat-containing protein [Senna tora]
MSLKYGFEPTVVTWTTLIRVSAITIRSVRLEFYREAKKKGLELNRISCSTLIQGLCKSGLVRDAMKLLLKEGEKKMHMVSFQEMKLKVPFDIYTVNISMKHFAITRGPLLCCFAYSLARGLQPNIHSYNALIYGMFKLGKIKNAEKILEFMLRENALDIFTFNTMIYAYCRIKQVDKALKLVSYMKENGYEPDHVTCETLLEYCILAILLEIALRRSRPLME